MSKIFTLSVQDGIKGLAVAVLTSVLTFILSILQNGYTIDWKEVGVIGLTAGIAYVIKNFLSDENGKIAGKI